MGQNGGARPGAGRKRKDEKFKAPIAKAEKRIADRLPQLIDNLFELADGVTVQETDPKTGATTVYTRPPDRQANEYLLNRIMGKPTERQEVSGPDGTALEVTAPALDRAAQEITAWREQMTAQLNGLNAAPTPPMPATPTASLTMPKDSEAG